MNKQTIEKRNEKKYNIPVIGHFIDKSIRFNSIIEAEQYTGINYHLIFENAIGKIKTAKGSVWEFENGVHWLKYKSQHIRQQDRYTRFIGFNG